MKKISLSIATLLAALSIATMTTNAYAQDGGAGGDGSGCPCCNGSTGGGNGSANQDETPPQS
ncbi:MAG: hypothetical protein ACO1N3_05155 [Gammaproteobacteria bacterium]